MPCAADIQFDIRLGRLRAFGLRRKKISGMVKRPWVDFIFFQFFADSDLFNFLFDQKSQKKPNRGPRDKNRPY